MSYIGAIYPAEELSGTNWSRIHLFYTLFTSIGHLLYGLAGLEKAPRRKLTQDRVGRIRVCLDEISAVYDKIAADLDNLAHPKDYKSFIDLSRRRTTDTASRIGRALFVCKKLEACLR